MNEWLNETYDDTLNRRWDDEDSSNITMLQTSLFHFKNNGSRTRRKWEQESEEQIEHHLYTYETLLVNSCKQARKNITLRKDRDKIRKIEELVTNLCTDILNENAEPYSDHIGKRHSRKLNNKHTQYSIIQTILENQCENVIDILSKHCTRCFMNSEITRLAITYASEVAMTIQYNCTNSRETLNSKMKNTEAVCSIHSTPTETFIYEKTHI